MSDAIKYIKYVISFINYSSWRPPYWCLHASLFSYWASYLSTMKLLWVQWKWLSIGIILSKHMESLPLMEMYSKYIESPENRENHSLRPSPLKDLPSSYSMELYAALTNSLTMGSIHWPMHWLMRAMMSGSQTPEETGRTLIRYSNDNIFYGFGDNRYWDFTVE